MFAVVAQKSSWSMDRLLFNWFDVAVVLVLAFGFWRGRKRGMSQELLPASLMLVLVLAAGLGHELLGDQLQQWGLVRKVFGNSFNERTAALVSAYLLIALVVFLLFSVLNKFFKARMEGSNLFGSGEYYLGMIAGTVRYGCILVAALALLNAPFYSQAEIQATKAYNNRWYGGGLQGYSGDFIPSIAEVQTAVFKKSILGPFIKEGLSLVLINSVAPGAPKKTGPH